jgi:hypothetical protein
VQCMTSVSSADFRQGTLLRSDGSAVVLIVEQVGELGLELELKGESWLGEGLREQLWERECLAILSRQVLGLGGDCGPGIGP